MSATAYSGSLHAAVSANNFDNALLAEFIVRILRDPNARSQHAVDLYAGDWNRASTLLQYAETNEFAKMLLAARTSMTKHEQSYTKDDFIIAVQSKMSTFEGELWLKTAQFYAKLQGFVTDAPTVAIQNNNVIHVPAKAQSDSAWEQNAKQAQYALQAEAREIHE